VARSVLVVPAASDAHLARTCLGLLRALDRLGVRVGFVKPVSQLRPNGGPDRSGALVAAVSSLQPPEPLSAAELEFQLGAGGMDTALEKIVAAWEPVCRGRDVVVIEAVSPGPLYATRIIPALAAAFDADVLLAARWPDGPASEDGDGEARAVGAAGQLAEMFAIAAGEYSSGEEQRVLGCVAHDVPPGPATAQLRAALERCGLRLIAAVPHRPDLGWLRVLDLVRELNPRVLAEGDMTRRIRGVAVFAQGVPGGLRVLTDGRLVVVPGDRHDVIMAACLAALNGTRLAALLLSAGIEPDPRIQELTTATVASGLPILMVDDDSYPTATRVRDLDPGLPADDIERVEAVTASIADVLDPSWLASLAGPARSRRLSPVAFRYHLTVLARAADTCIVLPEGTEPRVAAAAVACAEQGIARCLLLGPPEEVAATVHGLGLRLSAGVTVTDPRQIAERYVAPLAELRRHRGWTRDTARDHLADPAVVGAMMLREGAVDGMVAGAVATTASTVRTALQVVGARPGCRLVSSVFFMCLPDEVVIYGDCAVNPQPDADDLAEIAIQSAGSAVAFGIEPRIAMISFSTGTSGAGDDVEKVARATEIVRQREPGLAVDGPLQYDAAAVASVAQAKRPGSPVAGRATVFIFPDLDSGNATYKAVQRSAHVVSIGPMLQGLALPVNDLSRGALADDIVCTIALTAVQARAGSRGQPGSEPVHR